LVRQQAVQLVLALLRLAQLQAAQAASGHQQVAQGALVQQAVHQALIPHQAPPAGLVARLLLVLQQVVARLVVHPPLGLQALLLVALVLLAALLRLVLVVALVLPLQPVRAAVAASHLGSRILRVGGAGWLQGAAAPRVSSLGMRLTNGYLVAAAVHTCNSVTFSSSMLD
jgi:hypothetical protein